MEPTEFGPQQPAKAATPEFGPTVDLAIRKSPAQQRAEKYLFGSLFNVEPDTLQPMVETGATAALDQTANAKTETNKQDAVNISIANPVEDKQAEITALQEELQGIDYIKRFASPAVIAMLSSQDPVLRDYSVRRVKRLIAASDIVQKRVGEASDGFWAGSGDFVDTLLSSPKGILISQKNREYADRYAELMYSSLSDADFETQLNDMMTEMSDTGWFTDTNRFYLNNFLSIAGAGSESNIAQMDKIFGAIDTVSTVAGPILKPVQTFKAARAAVTTTALTSGVLGRGALGVAHGITTDIASLIGFKTNNVELVRKIISEAAIIDDPLRAGLVLGNHVTPSIATSTLMRPAFWSETSHAAARVFEESSQVFRSALQASKISGEAIDDATFNTFKTKLTDSVRKDAVDSGNTRYLDADLLKDETENLFLHQFYGTQSGGLFNGNNGRRAAQNLADQMGGEVVSGDIANTWKVRVSNNVPADLGDLTLSDMHLFTSTNPDDLGEGLLVQYLGSPLAQTTPRLNAILKEGEAARETWRVSMQAPLKEVRRLNSRRQQNQVFGMFDEMRDGSLAARRKALSPNEFVTEFATKYGKPPSESQVAMYLKYQEALDVDAMFKADVTFKLQVKDGVVVDSATGYRIVPKVSDNMTGTTKVWDTATGKLVEAKDLPAGTRVFQNYDPLHQNFPGDVMHMTDSSIKTRRLYHSDVMARNAGGPRDYRKFDIQFYVKQNRVKQFADGSEVTVSPLTVMGVRTEAQAIAAKTQINNIIDVINQKIVGTFKDAAEHRLAVRALVNDPQLNAIIADNNKWFPDAYNADEFVKWADEAGVDLRKQFDFVKDGEAIIDSTAVGGVAGRKYSEAIDMTITNPRARRDKLLIGYGGVTNRTYGSKMSIEQSLSRGVAINSERAYMSASINGLLKAAIEHNVLANVADLKGLSLKQKLLQASISDTTSIGRKLLLEQKKVIFRMEQKNIGDQVWLSAMKNASDFLYSKNLIGADFAADISSKNPLVALRGFAFDAKLGMFNPAQYWVQGSQALNIMAVSGLDGVRGTALYGPIRFAIANGDAAVIKSTGDLLQPISGLTGDQFLEMVTMFKNSGRGTVGESLAEFGSDAAQASRVLGTVGEGIGAARSAGRVIFNEGELIPRIASYATSYMEFLKKFPGVAANSQQGRRWIMNRQDTLTQGMTGASRTPVDKLPFTQFMSYMFRVNEAMFSGTFGGKGRKVLTNAERTRLAIVHTAMFGASAWGAVGTAMDIYRHYYGQELDPKLYRLIRKGFIDTLLTELTGTETSLSTRLSNSDGIFMIMQDVAEKNVIEFMGGVSLEVGWQGGKTAFSAVKTLVASFSGAEVKEPFKDDLIDFARVFSTGNMAYNAYTAFKYGEVTTRDNAYLDKIDNNTEAIFTALGVPLEAQEDAWKFNTFKGYDKEFDKLSAKGITTATNLWAEAFRRGDYEEAKKYARIIAMKYSSMTPIERQRVDKLVFTPKGFPITDELMVQALKAESGFSSNATE